MLRGLKTLAIRMERHCANARAVAEFLAQHPRVTTVLWPGLPEHPGHDIAARQMRDFGGMVSILVETEDEAVELVSRTTVWTLAESLGGVESLIEHPARMTHASTAAGPSRHRRTSFGCRSGSRRPTTSSPTSSARSPPHPRGPSLGPFGQAGNGVRHRFLSRAKRADFVPIAPPCGRRPAPAPRPDAGRRPAYGLVTSRKAVPVGSSTRASRPYGVSCAGSTIVPPSSVTCASVASTSATSK